MKAYITGPWKGKYRKRIQGIKRGIKLHDGLDCNYLGDGIVGKSDHHNMKDTDAVIVVWCDTMTPEEREQVGYAVQAAQSYGKWVGVLDLSVQRPKWLDHVDKISDYGAELAEWAAWCYKAPKAREHKPAQELKEIKA